MRLDRGLVVHRVQLHDPPGVRLRDASTATTASSSRWAARPVGTSRPLELIRRTCGRRRRAPRARDRLQAPAVTRRARSSARANWATRCGWTPSGRRRTRSTSTGSPRTTVTSARTCAGSRPGREPTSRLSTRGRRRPEAREAQRRLAFDVTASVHGEAAARQAVTDSQAAFKGAGALTRDELEAMRAQVPTYQVGREALENALGAAIASGAYASNGEARRAMQGGGFYVNDQRVTDPYAARPAVRAVLAPAQGQEGHPAGRARGLNGAGPPAERRQRPGR